MQNIFEKFQHWDNAARPMLRWWFPDASADLNQVRHQLETFVSAGFGGVEVAMVPQNVDFDPAVYGWATDNWKNIMKTILRAAPEDFVVDFTITAHWPPALDTVEPNADAAMQQLPFACQKVSPGEKCRLPMPAPLRHDRDGAHTAEYIFRDEFVAASVAKVKDVCPGKRITLELSSMRDVTEFCTRVPDAKTGEPLYTPAGIPEDAVAFGDKPKLADRQYYYEIDLEKIGIDLSASAGSALQAGDWLLFAFYRRGTGQTLSGRDMPAFSLQLPRAGKVYATDYFSDVSAKALTDFWETEILSDPEILELMKKRKGAIFEDSIETGSENLMWTVEMLPQFRELNGYELAPYLPLLASTKGSPVRFVTSERVERRIRDDYEQTMNQLYVTHHVKVLQEWAHTFGCQYRAQAYGGFIDTSRASTVLDIAEGETLGFGDAENDQAADKYRAIAGGVHMRGGPFVSQEALAMLGKSYAMTWKEAVRVLNRSMAAGANRAIFHGASFDKSFGNVCSQWPGWHAFAAAFAESWTDRQAFWADTPEIVNYVARVQSVLQGGQPQTDVAVFKKLWMSMTGRTALLDGGYSYDIISGPHLFLPSAKVQNGILAPGYGNYRALIVCDVKSLEKAEAEKLLDFASAGLPVILSGFKPNSVFGFRDGDSKISDLMDELLRLPNTRMVEDEADLPAALAELGVAPGLAGDSEGLRFVRRRDFDGTDYYFIVNRLDECVHTSLRPAGTGRFYELNAWNGSCKRADQDADGSLRLTLDANEAVLIAVSTRDLSREPCVIRPADLEHDAIPVTGFSLKLESWGPGTDERDHPERPSKTEICFPAEALGGWDDLPVETEDLNRLGVADMHNVAGIGVYSATVTLDRAVSAWLVFRHGQDMVTGVQVNGSTVDGIDHTCDRILLDHQLKAGENSLVIKLATPLNNRVILEQPSYMDAFGGPPPALLDEQAEAEADTYDYEDYVEPFDGGFPDHPRDMHYGLYGAFLLPID